MNGRPAQVLYVGGPRDGDTTERFLPAPERPTPAMEVDRYKLAELRGNRDGPATWRYRWEPERTGKREPCTAEKGQCTARGCPNRHAKPGGT